MDFVKGWISFVICFIVGWVYGHFYLKQEYGDEDYDF